jgi:hypothetical protein
VEDPDVFRSARGGYLLTSDTGPWQEIYAKELATAVHPSPAPLRAAE